MPPIEGYVRKLQVACDALGIDRGRAKKYIRLMTDYRDGARSGEHLLAVNESTEVCDIYDHWESHLENFPGLRHKIVQSLQKGPILREHEDPGKSTNRPRNTSFVFLLSGLFLTRGLNVVCVEGLRRAGVDCHTDGDFTCRWQHRLVDIQAKRPQSLARLDERVKQAVSQIETTGRPDQLGIVAVDCSAVMRPAFKVLEDTTAASAFDRIQKELRGRFAPRVQAHITPQTCGYVLVARVPTRVQEESRILGPSGSPFVYVTPFSVSCCIAVENDDCVDGHCAAALIRPLESPPTSS